MAALIEEHLYIQHLDSFTVIPPPIYGPERLFETHKKLYGIASGLAMFPDSVYNTPKLKAQRSLLLTGLLKELSDNLQDISGALSHGQFLYQKEALLACYEEQKRMISQFFDPLFVQLQTASKACEIVPLLKGMDFFLKSFKDEAILKFAQGQKQEAVRCLAQRESTYDDFVELFKNLKKKRISGVVQHYDLLGKKSTTRVCG